MDSAPTEGHWRTNFWVTSHKMINRVGFIQQQVLCMFASSCPFWNYCFSVTMWLSRKNWLLVSIEENKTPIVRLFMLPPTRPEFLKCCGVTAIFGMYSCLPVVCHASMTKALKLFGIVKMFCFQKRFDEILCHTSLFHKRFALHLHLDQQNYILFYNNLFAYTVFNLTDAQSFVDELYTQNFWHFFVQFKNI